MMPWILAVALAFAVTSPAFTNGGKLPVSGAQRACGGGSSVSPPLTWSNVPAGVTSFAIVLHDPDAPVPGGFVHWVTYGIPVRLTAVPANFGAAHGHFIGYCPPTGDAPHHYVFTVYATDVAPRALEPGLTWDALLAALHGHVKGSASIVGRYGQ